MRIFVFGGTVFVGRHFVEAALARGHDVTLFHRGKHGPSLFPKAHRVLGDRDGGLAAIVNRNFDAVVDVSGYLPRVVRQSVQAFLGNSPTYLFVSTVSVYRDVTKRGQDEDGQLIELEDPATEDINSHYGGLKVLCEREVLSAFPEAFIVRPGLVAGPHDPTNRFTYWVDRMSRGGRMLVPNRPDQPLQLVDARDLANFMVLGLERGLHGTYNTTGEEITFGEMIDTCHHFRPETELVWVSEEFQKKHEIEFPLVLPEDGSYDGLMTMDSSKARVAGLDNRPLLETARDTLQWRKSVSDAEAGKAVLSPEKEQKVLVEALSDVETA